MNKGGLSGKCKFCLNFYSSLKEEFIEMTIKSWSEVYEHC